ncbi:MAG: hypothetical protein KIT14_06545 [bacterium]|nr:hypothetical protein [bacterium]
MRAPDGASSSPLRPGSSLQFLKLPGRRKPWAIEIKRGLAPRFERGFQLACETVRPDRRLIVYGGTERFPIADGVEAVPLVELCEEVGGVRRRAALRSTAAGARAVA